MRAERHGHEFQTTNKRFQYLQQKQTTLGVWKFSMHMENIGGRLPNQIVRNRAKSFGNGPTHMKNIEKNTNN